MLLRPAGAGGACPEESPKGINPEGPARLTPGGPFGEKGENDEQCKDTPFERF